jgi:hypothetical protein
MTVQERGLLQKVIEHVLQECEPCREDMAKMYQRYPQATWFWTIACDDHRTRLRDCVNLHVEYGEIKATIPTLERIKKGLALSADPKLSMKKALEYKNLIKELEMTVPIAYKGSVIEDLQIRLDNISTDMLYWLKSS